MRVMESYLPVSSLMDYDAKYSLVVIRYGETSFELSYGVAIKDICGMAVCTLLEEFIVQRPQISHICGCLRRRYSV